MKKLFASLSICVLFLASAALAAPIKFARYPHINKGRIAFSYHGDIWVANDDGLNPRRLTAHVATDVNPRFAPDVFVKNSPKDELDGFDRELDTAVKEALMMLKEGKWQYER